MHILMDADCLIKLTEAGLKELVCTNDVVAIPMAVMREAVDEGKARGFPDAAIIEQNLDAGRLRTVDGATEDPRGDEALVATFRAGGHDVVASDDSRLLRRMRALRIPCVVPGLLVYRLFARSTLDRTQAISALAALSPFVSAEQSSTVRLLLEVNP